MSFIPDSILRGVCWSVLLSLWLGLIVALVAGIIMVLSKKAHSALRYNLLCSLVILFLAVSGYTFYRQLHITVAEEPGINNINPATGIKAAGGIAPLTAPQNASHILQNGIVSLEQYFNTHASLVVITWFIIFLARFVKVLSGLVYAQWIRHYQTSPAPPEWRRRLAQLLDKLQIKRSVSLLESAIVKIPVVVGVLKPVILVPLGMLAQLSPGQVESILIHELAHIRRRDYLFNLVQHLVDTVFFFNPALIWVSSLIRGERENCCDDIAIRETRSRRQFVEALVSFHEYTRSVQGYALYFAAKENQVVQRVKRIVNRKNHSLNAGERVLLMGGLMAFSVAFITINGSRAPLPQRKAVISASGATVKGSSRAVNPSEPVTSLPATASSSTSVPTRKTSNANDNGNGNFVPAAPVLITPPAPARDTQPDQDWPRESSLVELREDLWALGFHHFSVDKLIQCQQHGVRADFISELKKMGYTDISLDKAIQLKDHGVSPEYIQEIKEMGYPDITLDKATELRDHGVSSYFISGFKNIGYNRITLERAQELRDHGVSAEYISNIRQLGFPNLSLDKAQELRDHGVTSEFIAAFKKKTGVLLEIDDYIKLRDSGISPSS
jgi:beta-lactamase regulating signal transducer with metallopeptidase domain